MSSTPQTRSFMKTTRHVAYGRHISVEVAAEPPFQEGPTPVFDKARHQPKPRARHEDFECSRNANDARVGRTVTAKLLGDPDPDRFARSEEVRKILADRDAKTKIAGSLDVRPPRGPQSQSRTPVVDRPPARYMPVPPEHANIEARRGDYVMQFPTVSVAARCLTGNMEPRSVKAIRNAVNGITRTAYGWEWTRLKASRRGPRL